MPNALRLPRLAFDHFGVFVIEDFGEEPLVLHKMPLIERLGHVDIQPALNSGDAKGVVEANRFGDAWPAWQSQVLAEIHDVEAD